MISTKTAFNGSTDDRDDALFAALRSSVGVSDLITELSLKYDGEIHIAPLTEMLWRGVQYGLTSDEIRKCLDQLITKADQLNAPLQIDLTAEDCDMPTEEEMAAWT